MFTKHITKKDGATGSILWEADVELPSNIQEAIDTLDEKYVYETFLQRHIIKIQSANDPRKESSLLGRDALAEIREARKAGVDVDSILDAVRKLKKAQS